LTDDLGSNVLVAGTAVFGSKDPKKTITEMRTQVDDNLSLGEGQNGTQETKETSQ
jgi:hypothetical protein